MLKSCSLQKNNLRIINYRYWTFQDFFLLSIFFFFRCSKKHHPFIRITPLVCKVSPNKEHNTQWLSINRIYPQLLDSQLSSVHKQEVERSHHSTDAASSVSALYLTLRLHIVCVTGTSYKLCGLNVAVICHIFCRLHPSNCALIPNSVSKANVLRTRNNVVNLLVGLNRN